MGISNFNEYKKLKNEKLVYINNKQLKEIQNIEFNIAKDVVNFCKRNNIRIYLGGGSALGAIRHKGFIPWDDDIDFNMPREDANVFIKLFSLEYKEKYDVRIPGKSKGYNSLMIKIMKKGTIARTIENVNNDICGLGVDIFQIENTYDNVILRNIHGYCCIILSGILSCVRIHKNYKDITVYIESSKKIKLITFFKNIFGCILSIIPIKTWVKIADNCNSLCKNNLSKFVTVPTGRNRFFNEMFERKKILSILYVDFETEKWPITSIYDEYLKKLFGNYMKVPDNNEIESHPFIEIKY